MSVAAKMRPINIRFRPKTPARILSSVKKQFADYIIDSSDEYEDWFESDLHKTISSTMKPSDYLRHFREAHGLTQKELSYKYCHFHSSFKMIHHCFNCLKISLFNFFGFFFHNKYSTIFFYPFT